MKIVALLLVIILVGVCAFRVASIISPDAVSMAVGMLFGVLAGIPTALLVMASGRRRYDDEDDEYRPHRVRDYDQQNLPNGQITVVPPLPTVYRPDYVYLPVTDDEPLEW